MCLGFFQVFSFVCSQQRKIWIWIQYIFKCAKKYLDMCCAEELLLGLQICVFQLFFFSKINYLMQGQSSDKNNVYPLTFVSASIHRFYFDLSILPRSTDSTSIHRFYFDSSILLLSIDSITIHRFYFDPQFLLGPIDSTSIH